MASVISEFLTPPVAEAQVSAFEPPAATYATYKDNGVASEALALGRSLWRSRYRRRIGLLASGIAAVLGANMIGQIRLNQWQGAFFDVLAKRDVVALGGQLLVFLAIISVLLSLVVGQTWMQEMLKVRLREWL